MPDQPGVPLEPRSTGAVGLELLLTGGSCSGGMPDPTGMPLVRHLIEPVLVRRIHRRLVLYIFHSCDLHGGMPDQPGVPLERSGSGGAKNTKKDECAGTPDQPGAPLERPGSQGEFSPQETLVINKLLGYMLRAIMIIAVMLRRRQQWR